MAFSLFPKLRAKGRNNSQHYCANIVGSCCARVGSGVQTDYSNPDDHTEPIYELTTMLGPAVHRGKNATLCKFEFDSLLAFVALTMLEELCKWIQNCHASSLLQKGAGATLLANNSQHCWMLYVASACVALV